MEMVWRELGDSMIKGLRCQSLEEYENLIKQRENELEKGDEKQTKHEIGEILSIILAGISFCIAYHYNSATFLVITIVLGFVFLILYELAHETDVEWVKSQIYYLKKERREIFPIIKEIEKSHPHATYIRANEWSGNLTIDVYEKREYYGKDEEIKVKTIEYEHDWRRNAEWNFVSETEFDPKTSKILSILAKKPTTCPTCGGTIRGDICEYCGREI